MGKKKPSSTIKYSLKKDKLVRALLIAMLLLAMCIGILQGIVIVCSVKDLSYNTILASKDDIIPVNEILEDGTVYLEDGTRIDSKDIKSYIRVLPGNEIGYVKDVGLISPVTLQEYIKGNLAYLIIYLCVNIVVYLSGLFVIKVDSNDKLKRFVFVVVLLYIIYNMLPYAVYIMGMSKYTYLEYTLIVILIFVSVFKTYNLYVFANEFIPEKNIRNM